MGRDDALSDPRTTMLPMTWHPWRVLARLPEIKLRWERMPGLLGAWHHTSGTITLHPDQSQAERRCTLTHELIHAERGHEGRCCGLVERQVQAETARRLIPLDALATALVWTQDEWEVADELWVDVETARVRIENLTDPEKHYIERRIAAREDAA